MGFIMGISWLKDQGTGGAGDLAQQEGEGAIVGGQGEDGSTHGNGEVRSINRDLVKLE